MDDRPISSGQVREYFPTMVATADNTYTQVFPFILTFTFPCTPGFQSQQSLPQPIKYRGCYLEERNYYLITDLIPTAVIFNLSRA